MNDAVRRWPARRILLFGIVGLTLLGCGRVRFFADAGVGLDAPPPRDTSTEPAAECLVAGDCTSEVACVQGLCSVGLCEYVPNSERCADGELCDLELGCRRVPDGGMDGGMDAGTDAGDAGDGGVDAAGDGGPDAAPDATFRPPTHVTAGSAHTCTTRADGHLSCWGIAARLGIGPLTGTRSTGQAVAPLADVVDVAAAFNHTCAVHGTGELSCWGTNTFYQLGDGTTTSADTPRLVTGLGRVTRVWATTGRTCAQVDGQFFCWGQNTWGQAGDPSGATVTAPRMVTAVSGVLGAALTNNATCVRRASDVVCFGLGHFGTGVQNTDPAGRITMPLASVEQIAAGTDQICAQVSGGRVHCMGQNGSGQVGAGGGLATTPVLVPVPEPASVIFAGHLRSCALTAGGTYCWGRNLEGQLGTGDTLSYPGPVLATEIVDARDMVMWGTHTCFWNTSNALYCFGTNDFGQLGDGTATGRTAATAVMLD